MLLSSTRKAIKINKIGGEDGSKGKLFTSVEPKSEINGFQLVKDSGLILIASDEPRIGTYFIPQLDNAPKWLPFLENITEELEEETNTYVYDQFKLVTLDELEGLKATHLLGTKMLKQHMHGYLLHMKLYQKLKDKSQPFAFQEYKQQLIQKKYAERNKSRLQVDQELVGVKDIKNI